ncbi:Very-long-chain 3-oxoacyl-CoA reductase [Armadillidium nasatum]|uniref:Very-long-chain 3-oxoacyl-CoA reductase n=1 Tax=Armadillidium nasatum TaxID=96803 RepID=A0A5N5SJY1_9CRUS|nr:Very-long-chain 3-oxoacyl-CoA reductase [Armadillidium nasatum]
MWELAGKVLVAAVAARSSWVVGKGLYTSYLGSWFGRSVKVKQLGRWAVITGATDGIGKAYAFEMARNNLNVVLISRSEERLRNVADEIASKYNVKAKTIQADFTERNIYNRIEDEISNLEIGVLVNNVGMTYDYPKEFTEVSEKLILDLFHCNILSVTMMTKIVLEKMQKRNKGLIVTLSSMGCLVPMPYLTLYGALKAYIVFFTKSLANENRSNNVIIQCHVPALVATKFSGFTKPNILVPTPMESVQSSMRTADIPVLIYRTMWFHVASQKTEVTLYLATVANFLNKWISESIMNTFANSFFGSFRSKAIARNKKMAKRETRVQQE